MDTRLGLFVNHDIAGYEVPVHARGCASTRSRVRPAIGDPLGQAQLEHRPALVAQGPAALAVEPSVCKSNKSIATIRAATQVATLTPFMDLAIGKIESFVVTAKLFDTEWAHRNLFSFFSATDRSLE